MSSLQYSQVYSRLFTMAQMHDFLDLTDLQSNEFLCNWLHSAISNQRFQRLFSSFSLDDEIQTINFEFKYPSNSNDGSIDIESLIEILTKAMAIKWLTPKVLSLENIHQTYGSTELKYYSESSHLKELKDLLTMLENSYKEEITDRTSTLNSYLSGES